MADEPTNVVKLATGFERRFIPPDPPPTPAWVFLVIGTAAVVVVGASVTGSWGAVKFGTAAVATARADENRALVAADAALESRVRATEDSIGEIKKDVGQVRRDVSDIRAALYDYMVEIEVDKAAARLAPKDGGAR